MRFFFQLLLLWKREEKVVEHWMMNFAAKTKVECSLSLSVNIIHYYYNFFFHHERVACYSISEESSEESYVTADSFSKKYL